MILRLKKTEDCFSFIFSINHLLNKSMEKILSSITNYLFADDSTNNTIESITTKHLVIDQSGNIGSLYDTCTDSIEGKLFSCPQPEITNLSRPIFCEVYNGGTSKSENLPKMVGIDQSLHLSLILKMVQPTGVALIIDYPKPIDRYTRFLHFRYKSHIESCDADWCNKMNPKRRSKLAKSKAYVVTQIIRGIDAIVVLQFSSAQEDHIDHLLKKISRHLINDKHYLDLTSTETDLLNQITSTTIYSNITMLTRKQNLISFCQMIQQMKDQKNKHGRISYGLTHVIHQDDVNSGDHNTTTKSEESVVECFQNELFRRFDQLKHLQFRLDVELTELLQGKLAERIFEAQQSFQEIRTLFKNDMEHVRELVKKLRKNQTVSSETEAVLNSDVQNTIRDYIHRLVIVLNDLTSKGDLIRQLQSYGFEYWNIGQFDIEHDWSEEMVREALFLGNSKKMVICVTDKLKQQSPDRWDSLYSQMQEQLQKNSQCTIVYADFSYSRWPLEEMTILHSKEQRLSKCPSILEKALSEEKPKSSLPVTNAVDDCINILLLGESGVGKSTFINAFANYLYFDSLENAKTGQPIVVIPVSFLMTTNDDFEERLIKFGEPNSNENHNDIGQSVTQQCRAYLFESAPGKKLRIIDTPGFADTRSDAQDQINMNTVFSFVKNLPHLNAICLLLKPNTARLNPFLYPCFTQIFEWFGEGIRDHVIFCFTNARSTFFAPGDTGPLLRSFLQTFPVTNIPFAKKNVFCFDSESFRYLVALQGDLQFDQIKEDEFANSWAQSVEESQRLRTFICDKLHPYRQDIEWHSLKYAYYQINLMSRPIFEAIRNIQRNIILYQTNCTLRLKASYVDRPMIIDDTLNRSLNKCGDFWVFLDYLRPLTHVVSEVNIYSAIN